MLADPPVKGQVELHALCKQFENATAVDSVSITIQAGSYCCLLGPSGCGKSTTLRLLAGHETSSSGAIIIDGHDVTGMQPSHRGTAMMFQSYALFPHLDCVENVAFALKLKKVDKATRRKKALELLEMVQMESYCNRLPSQLSGGQQQRVALARALQNEPSVLLLDEPLSALDPFLRIKMRAELRRLQKELGITFIHVTHSQAEALALSDQVIVMNHGKIEQSGEPREVYLQPENDFVARFIGGHNVLEGVCVEQLEGEGVCTLEDKVGARYKIFSNRQVELGASYKFSVRTDAISISDRENTLSEDNIVSASVLDCEYQGDFIKLGLTLKNCASDFSVQLPDPVYLQCPVEVGQEIHIGWSLNSTSLLQKTG